MSDAAKVRKLLKAINEVPGFLDQLSASVDALERLRSHGQRLYRASHWGRGGVDRDKLASAPNAAGGVVELGRLYELSYLTKKGRDTHSIIYQHAFRSPFPILAYAIDGSGLVIVRDGSRYTVTSHGIEG